MDQTQNGKVIIGPQMDPNMAVQDADIEEDKARSEATFRFTVPNFSKLKDYILSPPTFVRNLPWKIMVIRRRSDNQDRTSQRFLSFFLQCNGERESSSWSCYAVAELRLLSVRPDIENFSRKIQHIFYSKENDWGISHFMAWNDILDPEKGYIKDDSITLEVHLVADAPYGVSCDSKKHTDTGGAEMDQTQNGEVIIGPQMDPNMAVQNTEIQEDKARSEATFRFTVPNFSKQKDLILSPPTFVRNLPWKIVVMRRRSHNQDHTSQRFLSFFLQCNGESESSSWSCYAEAELRLLSVRPDIETFSRKIQHLFYSKENDWGISHFMAWNDVLAPEKGYIKDDSIILEVHVVADAPNGVSQDSKKHTD